MSEFKICTIFKLFLWLIVVLNRLCQPDLQSTLSAVALSEHANAFPQHSYLIVEPFFFLFFCWRGEKYAQQPRSYTFFFTFKWLFPQHLFSYDFLAEIDIPRLTFAIETCTLHLPLPLVAQLYPVAVYFQLQAARGKPGEGVFVCPHISAHSRSIKTSPHIWQDVPVIQISSSTQMFSVSQVRS